MPLGLLIPLAILGYVIIGLFIGGATYRFDRRRHDQSDVWAGWITAFAWPLFSLGLLVYVAVKGPVQAVHRAWDYPFIRKDSTR